MKQEETIDKGVSRRAALKLLGAQIGLAAAGCSKPSEEIVPYVRMPERLVPGMPLRFATTLPLSGFGRGVMCTSVEGRPIKIEGNPLHPASLGATDVFAEAAVLSLYDPDRSQVVRHAGEISTWEAFAAELSAVIGNSATRGVDGLRLLTGPITSPTLLRQIGSLRNRYPKFVWHVHDPLENGAARDGAVLAFERPLLSVPQFRACDTIVSFDADPLGPGVSQIANARGLSARRRVRKSSPTSARLYVIEASPSLTGANADHRLALPPDRIAALVVGLGRQLGEDLPDPHLAEAEATLLEAIHRDLAPHAGRGIVLVGPTQPAEIHAIAHWINGQIRAPVDLFEPPGNGVPPGTLSDLVRDLEAGKAESVVIIDCNPAHEAPPALDFASALRRSKFRVHVGSYADETAAICDWHIPQSHVLESWSDLRAFDGTASLVQPLIAPLYATHSSHELLAILDQRGEKSDYEIVRDSWRGNAGSQDFEAWWRRALHDGVIAESAPAKVTPSPKVPSITTLPASTRPSLVLRPDPSIFDGAFANNAWLQELPKPLTKEVWGNTVALSTADAERLGVAEGEVLRLTVDGQFIEVPARIDSRQASGVFSTTLGYGRKAAGRIGDGLGVNAYALRSAPRARRGEANWAMAPLTVSKTGERVFVPSTQHQFTLDGEPQEVFRSYTLPEFLGLRSPSDEPRLESFFPVSEGGEPRWGMVIDTSLCIGCNACVVACQVENNSPVVGPEEIALGRGMHWLRVDSYELGRDSGDRIGFQPVPCMHCEAAPCEPVCPVEASVHDSEGLNVQVYNRCIGTRFCQANCPYKVRRFNYFGYADGQEYAGLGGEVMRLHNNPDVTVRARGVMEKCTFCVQRISRARRNAEKLHRGIADGEVVTACQASCPTSAISFGDLSEPQAAVSALRKEPHHYELLGHLNTKPRTTYLAQIRNPGETTKAKP